MIQQLGLIGCGLIGGSVALALKAAGAVQRVVGYSPSPTTTERARALGVIDAPAESALRAISGADVVLIAVPVAATERTFKTIRELLPTGVLVMDVGSTKRDVVDAARRVLRARVSQFVPAHPIAGKELSGVEHADALLFQGKRTILTPLVQTDTDLLAKAEAIWRACGADVVRMTPDAHDDAFAAVSHLPHLIAFAYFAGILQQKEADQFLALAGPGFRDFTRIAASDPAIWRDILVSNREQVLAQSARFRGALDVLERTMRETQGEALEALISGVSQARSHWRLNKQ